jgi:NADH-quinone oxidoreductase subunit N
MDADLRKFVGYKKNLMIKIFSEIFLGISLLLLLVYGSIIGFSAKYNYPVISYKGITLLILFWTLLLLRLETSDYFTIYFVEDHLSQYSKIFITIGLILCLNMESGTKRKTFEYYVLTLTGLLGLFFLTASSDFLSVYLSLELTTFSFYILTLSQRNSAFSVEAALKYFILGTLASALLVFGVSIIYGLTGTTNLNHHLVLNLSASTEPNLLLAIELSFLCFSCGLLFKLGSVPFHVWVPDVYEGAPTYVTAIFSVLPKIAIFVVLIRVVQITRIDVWFYWFLVIGLLSILGGSLSALSQTKTKRLFALSGVSHVGYALLGLSCGTLDSYSSCLLYILVYISTAGFLWGLALCVKNPHGRTLYLTDYVQWAQTNPYLGVITIFVIFSLMGIPPFAGFFAKVGIFLGCAEISIYSVIIVGLLLSLIGVIYYVRLIKIISIEEVYWKKSVKLEKIHALSIGLFSFFLIFFFLYNDFLYIIINLITFSALP